MNQMYNYKGKGSNLALNYWQKYTPHKNELKTSTVQVQSGSDIAIPSILKDLTVKFDLISLHHLPCHLIKPRQHIIIIISWPHHQHHHLHHTLPLPPSSSFSCQHSLCMKYTHIFIFMAINRPQQSLFSQ